MQDLAIVHFLLRSSIILDEDIDTKAFEAWQEFSKTCMAEAIGVMGGQPLTRPVWIDDFKKKLATARPADRDRIEATDVRCVVRPQIFAFSYPSERRIEVSAISREHMRSINLLLWRVAEAVLDPETRDSATEAGQSIVEYVLPWVFALYYSDVNYSRLPSFRANNNYTVAVAQRFAKIQVEFLLAHEFAHALLHEGQRPNAALEKEADAFAYELLFEHEPFCDEYTGAEVYVALRWLFLYLSLDRVVGASMSGYDLDWTNLPIRERDEPLIARVVELRALRELWSVGSLADLCLFEAKYAIRDHGLNWLQAQAESFRTQFCRPLAFVRQSTQVHTNLCESSVVPVRRAREDILDNSTDSPSESSNDAQQTFTLELEIDTEGHPIPPEDFVTTLVDQDGLRVRRHPLRAPWTPYPP